MAISKEEAREWAEHLIMFYHGDYDYSEVYEDEDITEKFSDQKDWEAIHEQMNQANIKVVWGD